MSRPREALSDAVAVVLSVARLADEHDIKYPAAALAYYGFVSVLPLLVVVLAVVGDTAAGAVYAGTPQLLAPEPRRLVAESLRTATGRTGASVLALVAFSWCGVNVAADFLTVVGRVEGAPRRPRTERVRDALAVLSSLAVAVALVVLTGGVFAQLPADSSLLLGWPVALVVALVVAFLPLYYVPSRVVSSLSAALPGALTAAAGWTLLISIVRVYADTAAQYALYGVLSGLIVALTSFYLAAAALMLGVVVNAMYADGATLLPARFR